MNLNEFFQAKSEFSHVVQMVRNHIAEEHFISKVILSVSNSYEMLGEAMPKYVSDLTSNTKYGDMLHPHALKQYLHLSNQCTIFIMLLLHHCHPIPTIHY